MCIYESSSELGAVRFIRNGPFDFEGCTDPLHKGFLE